MSYEPVDIVGKLDTEAIRLGGCNEGVAADVALSAIRVDVWRDALVAELERLAQTFDDNHNPEGLPYERSNHRVALTYRHAARLVRGEAVPSQTSNDTEGGET